MRKWGVMTGGHENLLCQDKRQQEQGQAEVTGAEYDVDE